MKSYNHGIILALALFPLTARLVADEQPPGPIQRIAPLGIRLEEGAELGYKVSRSQIRTGRFEGGESTELKYALKVDKVGKDGSLEFELLVERVKFDRTGRAPIRFDSAKRRGGESVLMQALRDFVDKPMHLRIDARGKVLEMDDFPAPQIPLHWPDARQNGTGRAGADAGGQDDSRKAFRGSRREAHLQNVLSMMLRFVVSPDVVRADLQTIFGAGLQEAALRPGKGYRLEVPDRDTSRRSRSRRHPGPVPIYSREDRDTPARHDNPFSGGGNYKGRGGYDLRFSGLVPAHWGEAYEFELVQSFGPRDPDVVSRDPEVGLAYYRDTDGLLERLAYRHVMENKSPRDSHLLAWKVDIARE